MTNLLENPGFENGYRPVSAPDGSKPHHRAWVYEVAQTGGPVIKRYTVERDAIHNPTGWWSWYMWYPQRLYGDKPVPWDPNNVIGWSEPEIRLTETVHQRHRSGDHAVYLFTYGRIHEGGLFQQVQVEPGSHLRFQAFGHAWAAHDLPTPKSPACSNAGCGPLAWPMSNAGLDDDQKALGLWVGIDPTGGIDPTASTVIWSPGWYIYNAYRSEPLAVEATAQGSTVTVFLKSSALWPFTHNDVAWDDADLTVVDVAPPEPSSRRGAPRVQYQRTYLLLHKDESPEMWRGAMDALLALGVRWTLGQSADDAGIGDLDAREVVAVNPAMWGDGLEAFFAQHYPGVVYRPVYATTPEKLLAELQRLANGLPELELQIFSQRDRRWAGELMAPSHLTVGAAGCAMVSACMVATQVDPTLTPLELNRRLGANGGYTADGLLYWRKVADAVPGLRFKAYTTWRTNPKPDADMDMVRAAIERGPCVIQVDYAPGGALDTHFVVARRMLLDGDLEDIEIVDPWTGEVTTLRMRYWNGTLSQSIFALAEYEVHPSSPPVTPPAIPARQLISLHCQSFGDAEKEFFRLAQPAIGKVFDLGAAMEIKAASPETLVVYRHHVENGMIAQIVQNPGWGMDWFFDQMPDGVAEAVRAGMINYVETPLNEANQWFATQVWAAAELHFIERLRARLPGARPVTMAISVGNPVEADYAALIPLAHATAAAGGAGGYHGYKPIQQGQRFDDHAKWHECRHEGMDAVFRAAGVELDWILTEAGACGGEMQGEPGNQHFYYDSAAGWRDSACFGGNWPAYREMLKWYEARLRSGSARVLGAAIFTTCIWDWWGFHLGDQVRDMVW